MSRHQASLPPARKRSHLAFLSAAFAFALTLGCGLAGGSSVTPGPAPVLSPAGQTALPTVEITPTPLPPRAVLVAPEGDLTADALKAAVSDLAGEAGFRFEQLQQLPGDLASARVDLAVVIPPVDDLASVAASAPEIQFIAIGVQDLSPRQNLTVVGTLAERADEVGFLAGYLAALVSTDWRVASLSESDTTIGMTTRIAFANGAEFLCGLCRSVDPPYPDYPLGYDSPPRGNDQARQELLNQITRDGVEVMFVQQGLEDPDLANALADAGVRLIVVGTGESSQTSIAAIQGDPVAAVRSVWSTIVNGESAGSVSLPLRVDVIDVTRLTPGRFQHLQTILDDLERGLIDTGVDPGTGTPD